MDFQSIALPTELPHHLYTKVEFPEGVAKIREKITNSLIFNKKFKNNTAKNAFPSSRQQAETALGREHRKRKKLPGKVPGRRWPMW
jgi:hypothetical protein